MARWAALTQVHKRQWGRIVSIKLALFESAWWVRFVTFVFKNHNIGPHLLGLACNDLAGFVDVYVIS